MSGRIHPYAPWLYGFYVWPSSPVMWTLSSFNTRFKKLRLALIAPWTAKNRLICEKNVKTWTRHLNTRILLSFRYEGLFPESSIETLEADQLVQATVFTQSVLALWGINKNPFTHPVLKQAFHDARTSQMTALSAYKKTFFDEDLALNTEPAKRPKALYVAPKPKKAQSL